MAWLFRPATECFEKSRSEWDSLNQSLHNHILLDSGFVSPLLRHFGGDFVLYGSSRAPQASGAVLAIKKSTGIWETFQPSQAPIGPILLSPDERIEVSLRELMAGIPGMVLQFAATQLDPDFTALPPSLAGDLVEYLPHLRTPRLVLRGSAQDYWASRKKKLRENLSRYRRRLETAGHRLQFVVRGKSSDVAESLQEYSRLESTGWKGKEGSAVTPNTEQGSFYREVLEYFCERNEGMICQLYAGDKVIASRLALVRNGVMFMLKTAYDESFASCAPGMLLMQELVSHLYSEGRIKTIEFYGKVNEWHTYWTDEFREIYHLNFFRRKWVGKARALATRIL